MEWTRDEIKQLRYRLGYSQAEMARCLKLDLKVIINWELGNFLPVEGECNELRRIFNQAEGAADRVQRRPMAEVMMKERGLSQIHDFDVMTEFGRTPSKKLDN